MDKIQTAVNKATNKKIKFIRIDFTTEGLSFLKLLLEERKLNWNTIEIVLAGSKGIDFSVFPSIKKLILYNPKTIQYIGLNLAYSTLTSITLMHPKLEEWKDELGNFTKLESISLYEVESSMEEEEVYNAYVNMIKSCKKLKSLLINGCKLFSIILQTNKWWLEQFIFEKISFERIFQVYCSSEKLISWINNQPNLHTVEIDSVNYDVNTVQEIIIGIIGKLSKLKISLEMGMGVDDVISAITKSRTIERLEFWCFNNDVIDHFKHALSEGMLPVNLIALNIGHTILIHPDDDYVAKKKGK
jgi:hypothetical protein